MAGAGRSGDDLGTASPAHRSGDTNLMTSPVPVAPLPVPVRLSQHEIVVARLSVAHGHGEHASPLVACYQCLHGEAFASVTLRKAA
jgi:hypothetical protein